MISCIVGNNKYTYKVLPDKGTIQATVQSKENDSFLISGIINMSIKDYVSGELPYYHNIPADFRLQVAHYIEKYITLKAFW